MNLVDDIDLLPAFSGGICNLFNNPAEIFHSVSGRRVHLDHIQAAAFSDRAAGFTFPAWIPVYRMQTVDRLGQNFGAGRLARSAASAEQVRVRDPPGLYLIPECADNHVLSLDIVKGPWAVGSV